MSERIENGFVWTAYHIRQVCWYFIEHDDKTTLDNSAPFLCINLSYANLRSADLSYADLSSADLRSADLRSADLSSANLSSADLSSANLSGSKGTLSSIDYLDENFEKTVDGYIAYKTFGNHYQPNPEWKIEPGSILSEVVNPDRGTSCGCGVNVAKRDWNDFGNGTVWKVLVRWQWLAGVVVPFHTDGKIRCERVELVEIVER